MDYMKEYKLKKAKKALKNVLIYFGSILLITIFVLFFVCQKTTILGSSMCPVFDSGDEVIIDKITYKIREPKRYDIIILKFRYLADTNYVKRIIGLPGETVQIKDGIVYINGEVLIDEVYGLEAYIEDPGLAEEPITLGEGEYFVLGDNRNVSRDSRDKTVEKVKYDEIIGRAFIRVFPLSKFGFVKHK